MSTQKEFEPKDLSPDCINAYLQYVRFMQLSFGITNDEVKEIWAKNPLKKDE